MMSFWILAAVMIAVALWFIVPPLLGRQKLAGHTHDEVNIAIYKERLRELQADLDNYTLDREQFEQARQELERELAGDLAQGTSQAKEETTVHSRWSAATASVVVGVVAVALYFQLGTPISPATDIGRALAQADPVEQARMINEMVTGLAQKLEENPDNPEGWIMLARSFMVLERYPEASRAYARARQLLGDEPWLLADYAQAQAYAQGWNMNGLPAELALKALERDPDDHKALWLAGMAAAQQGDRRLALQRFRHLLNLLPPDSEVAGQMIMLMTRLGLEGPAADSLEDARTGSDKTAMAGPPSLSVQVDLAAELREQVDPTDTVFIFARAEEGPRLPLAVLRKQARDLPLTVVLDDSMAMVPEMKLSQFPRIRVVAQVSKSGEATLQSGDLRGMSSPVAVGDRASITINEVIR